MAHESTKFDHDKFREMLAKLSNNPSMNEDEKTLIHLIIVCLDAAIIKEFY